MDAMHLEARGRSLWARVHARVDEPLAQQLGQAVFAALGKGGFQFVAAELSGCPGLTSAGFGFFVKLQTALTTRGMRLFLVNPPKSVQDELKLRDLGEFFAVLEDIDENADDEELELFASS